MQGRMLLLHFEQITNTWQTIAVLPITVINDFNNPKRMDENNWVTFYGKNNGLDIAVL
jgi:poly(beta-D-mannuronate) lyase